MDSRNCGYQNFGCNYCPTGIRPSVPDRGQWWCIHHLLCLWIWANAMTWADDIIWQHGCGAATGLEHERPAVLQVWGLLWRKSPSKTGLFPQKETEEDMGWRDNLLSRWITVSPSLNWNTSSLLQLWGLFWRESPSKRGFVKKRVCTLKLTGDMDNEMVRYTEMICAKLLWSLWRALQTQGSFWRRDRWYGVAKTHRMPYLYWSFFAKVTYI